MRKKSEGGPREVLEKEEEKRGENVVSATDRYECSQHLYSRRQHLSGPLDNVQVGMLVMVKHDTDTAFRR